MTSPLREVCRGRWGSILPQLGVHPDVLNGRHQPCPICGGKDRFRYDDRDAVGGWICNKCGSGDGFTLLMKYHGWDFKEAARQVEPLIGDAPITKSRREQSEDRLRQAMHSAWHSAAPLQAGDAVSAYLERRGITVQPADIRYLDRCRYQINRDEMKTFPAMVAKVSGPDGAAAQVHRTYLSPELPQKAPIDPCRKLMPGRVPKGSAIRLMDCDPWLGVAEGIETALSASMLFSLPVWSAINSGGLMQFEPPGDVTEMTIFGDRDPEFGGQSAAYALAHRLSVQRKIKCRVAIPGEITGRDRVDWNDWLREAV